MKPRISYYGQTATPRTNARLEDYGSIKFFYSYDTVIAYEDNTDGLVVTINEWTTTTGKHLNYIDPNHDTRKDPDTFKAMLEAAYIRHSINDPNPRVINNLPVYTLHIEKD